MKQLEWQIQRAIHVYLSKALPHGSFAWAVDHAQKQSEAARIGMAARGCCAGIPDHMIIHEGKLISLEIKCPGNCPTESQRAFGLRLQNAQAYWFVVRSCEDVEAALRGIGVPLNASVRIPAPQTEVKKAKRSSARPVERRRYSAAAVRNILQRKSDAPRID